MILDVTFKSYLHLLSWLWWPIGRVLRLWRWECVRLLWVSSWCLWSRHKLCAVEISLEGLVEPISKNIFHAAGCKEDFWVSFSDSAGARIEGANCNTSVRFEPSLTIWCWWKLVGLIHKLCYLLLHWNILGDHSGLRSKRVNCSIGGGRDLKWRDRIGNCNEKLSHPIIVMVILTSCLFTSWARAMTTT